MRMEDLDPPREVPGAQERILKALESYGFEWDGETGAAERPARGLCRSSSTACSTTAWPTPAPARANNWRLSRHLSRVLPQCRARTSRTRPSACVYRSWNTASIDRVQGEFRQHLGRDVGDFIIRRRDGLYAYQLAVVLDDAWQGITDIVRGADLLDSTPRQLYLQELLGLPQPRYLHVPLITQPDGHKLGKSYRSPPLPLDQATPLLLRALRALGQNPGAELDDATPQEVLDWGIAHWDADEDPAHTRPWPRGQLRWEADKLASRCSPIAIRYHRRTFFGSRHKKERPGCTSIAWSCFWWWGSICFLPAIMDWWIDATGAWYRPYLLWLILIVVTFILQSQRDADEL